MMRGIAPWVEWLIMAVEVRIPPLGELVSQAVIARWLKESGEIVAVDETLLELETNEATLEIPAEVAGRLEILKGAGETVEVGTIVARIVEMAASPKPAAPEPALLRYRTTGSSWGRALGALVFWAWFGSITYVTYQLWGLKAVWVLPAVVLAIGAFEAYRDRKTQRTCAHGIAWAIRNPDLCQRCSDQVAEERKIADERRIRETAEREVLKAEFRRQMAEKRKEFIRNARNLGFLQTLDPKVFQKLIWIAFRNSGYQVEETPFAKDGGVDGFLARDSKRLVLQCKRYRGDIGEPTVRDLFGTIGHHGADGGILVTTGRVSEPAKAFARGKPIQLFDGKALLDLLAIATLTDDSVPDDFVVPPGGEPRVLREKLRKDQLAKCPMCDGRLIFRTGRRGPFYGCSRWPRCPYTAPRL